MKKQLLITLSLILFGLSSWAQEQVNTFTALEIEGPLAVELEKGSDHQVTRVEHAGNVSWKVSDGVLKIKGEKDGKETPKIRIQVSQLDRMALAGAVILGSNDTFSAEDFDLAIDGQCIVGMQLEAGSINIAANSQSIVSLGGSSGQVDLSANNQSIVNLEELRCSSLNVNADNQSIVSYKNGEDVQINSRSNRQSIIQGG